MTGSSSEAGSHAGQRVAISRAFLRSLPVLGLLDDEQLDLVKAAARVVTYAKRTTVVLKGSSVDHVAFLVTGKLQVVDYLPDGREFGLNIIHAGQFFGEMAVIDRQPRSATLVALTPSVVVLVPGEVTRRLFFHNPKVAEAIMRHLVGAIRRMSDLRALQAVPHSHQRVYALLCYVQEATPSRDGQVIHDIPTHQEMAIMVNTSRETVTRAIGRLIRAGVVRKSGRKLFIEKPDVLHRLVENPLIDLAQSE